MEKYQVKIEGTSPLLWNRMRRELELEIKKLKKNELESWHDDRKNWIRKTETKHKGKHPKSSDNVYVPAEWLKKAMVEAGYGKIRKQQRERYGNKEKTDGLGICR